MNWESLISDLWRFHKGKTIGVIIGLVFGLLTALIGFLKTFFITLCVAIGYLIGKRADASGNIGLWLERLFRDR